MRIFSTGSTNQSGSVAAFLVVAVLLAVVVIGGSYAVQKRGSSSTGQPVVPAKDVATPDGLPQASQDTSAKDEEQKRADAQKLAEAEKQAQAEAAKKAASEQAKRVEQQRQAQATAPAPVTVPQTGVAASTLPTTGPGDSVAQLVSAGVLLAIVGVYLRSYRYRFGSLFH